MAVPGGLPGSDTKPERPAIGQALTAHHTARRGKPTEADRPPVSTFPGRKPQVALGQLEITTQR